MAYGPERLEDREVASVAELDRLPEGLPVAWIDVVGLGDVDVLAALGRRFGIHRLLLEDVTRTHQRPKVEDFPGCVAVLLREPGLEVGGRDRQVSLFFGEGWLLSFRESQGEAFEPVRARIRQAGRLIRSSGADYLAYALIDAVVDRYLPPLEALGERMESLQERILLDPQPDMLAELFETRQTLAAMRRSAWPMRELLNRLIRDPLPGIEDETRIHLRDCYDHAVLVLELLEGHRESCGELMDFYLSSVSHRANEIMKVLTITGAIFIPLTFVAGIYGMNFDPERSPYNMPELRWAYGYPVAIVIMLGIAVGMLIFFRRKGWLR